MTQFLSLRQVFENFLTYQDLFIHLLGCACLVSTETSLVCSEALHYSTAFLSSAGF
jgi:hypothetical protein